MNFDNLREILLKEYDTDALKDYNMLYDVINYKNKCSFFKEEKKDKLLLHVAYIMSKYMDLNTHDEHYRYHFNFSNINSEEDFIKEIEKGKNIPINSKIIENDNEYDRFLRSINVRYYKHSSWLHLDRNDITNGNDPEVNEYTKRIYIPVTNDSLHDFTCLFLDELEKNNVKYYFKINNEGFCERVDNVVIYAGDKNFKEYIRILEKIKEEHPELKFNKVSPICYNYNDFLGIAPGSNYDKTSYTNAVCKTICEIRRETNNFEDFFHEVTDYLSDYLRSVANECEMIKNNQEYKKEKIILPQPKIEKIEGYKVINGPGYTIRQPIEEKESSIKNINIKETNNVTNIKKVNTIDVDNFIIAEDTSIDLINQYIEELEGKVRK